jgi:hypothetical protein
MELDEEVFGGMEDKRGGWGSVQGMEARVWCPFIAAERRWRVEEAVADVSAFLEGFGHYGEEKRWGAAPFRVEERRWLGGLVPIQ